jgi:hypothetical protein
MSLAQTQELMRTMQELMTLLNGVETKTAKITADMPQTKQTLAPFGQLERVAVRYLALAKRMGLPEDATRAIDMLSRLVVMARMARISINLLMVGTPFGWGLGIAGLAMTTMSLVDFGMNTG